jgi:two-component sensor histidine kinase
LTVSDNGVGFDPAAGSRGIGRRLIEALTKQMGGSEKTEAADGAYFELRFPLTAGHESP